MGQGRLELPTSRLSGVRSNHLSYWPGPVSPEVALASLGSATVSRSLETGLYAFRAVTGLTTRYAPKRFLRKEVIQPQVPLRLPCYDFTPVTNHSLGACLPCGLA